jgi:hypothetical protein
MEGSTMQHPFEGIMRAEPETIEARPTRRSVLGLLLGALAALFGAGAVASAQSPGRRPTTMAYGEEGGTITTYAYGEEGGVVTTYTWGEEGGSWPPQVRRPTTFAVGEEGGYRPPPVRRVPPVRRPTTLAFGEEGGVTTYAVGEEGGRS